MLAYGLKRCGAGSMPAIVAASPSVSSLAGFPKYSRDAASTPNARFPHATLLQYIVRISCFEYRFSIWSATSASLTLRMRPAVPTRSKPTASGNNCRASCCVMVLRPGVRRRESTSLMAAQPMSRGWMPPCVMNSSSSAEMMAFRRTAGMSS